ncbi:MAG: hypothetical protein DSY85_09275 [Marinomonas sp.]|nr:MAG: hypothetical protein DSY85_09275 [Marinomonas sp.]
MSDEKLPTNAQSTHSLDISGKAVLDLSGLNDEQRKSVTMKHHEAQIDLRKKAEQASIDIQATRANLDNFNQVVKDSSQDGTSITLTHTQNTSIGRTEVVMGNTEKAASGKVSRSAAGLEDISMKMIVIVGLVVVAGMLILN